MASLRIIRSGKISSLASVFYQNICRSIQRSPFATPVGSVYHKTSNVDAVDLLLTDILTNAMAAPNKSGVAKSSDKSPESEFLTKVALSQAKPNTSDVAITMDEWSQDDIDSKLTASMKCDDQTIFLQIVEQMLDRKRLPSDAVIVQMLSYLCNDRDDSMTIISRLIDLCQEINIAFYARNVEFVPFLSQYLWKFERFDDALNSLNTIFGTTNKTTKGQILRNYRQIIFDTVKNQDELILEKVIINAKHIYAVHRNPMLIVYLWGDCFFSGLFRNQQKADELFDDYDVIIMFEVSKNIGWIALTLLQNHNMDAIHRLIEKCLHRRMKREVDVCLIALFDYHCKL